MAKTSKPDVLLIGPPIHDAATQRLERDYSVHKYWLSADKPGLLAALRDRCRVAVTTSGDGAPSALIDALPKLQLIAYTTVGYDGIDMDAVRKRGIAVTNTPNVLNDAVAELAIGLMIAAARRIPQGDRYVREGRWLKGRMPLARQVSGKRLGVLGLGRIGQEIARRAQAFNMTIGYHSRRPVPGTPYAYYDTALALAKASDFLVIITPGGAATRYLVNEEVMRALGPDGVLVNVARGSVVDTSALVRCLQDGGVGAAALDVFEDEPKVPEALCKLDNAVLQPHVGSATEDTRVAMANLGVDNVDAFFAGKPLLTPVE
jgi:lactate dehydrogenase-like 2-hydroxyacid dehydrogenase